LKGELIPETSESIPFFLILNGGYQEAAALCEHILAERPNDLKILYLRDLMHKHALGSAHRPAYEPKVESAPTRPKWG
jgi:hypothetical protein